jgi:glyoxylase I family protein
VPAITGRLAVTLTVTDLARSVAWYRQLLSMSIRREYEPSDGRQRDASLVEPMSGLEVCLVEYQAAVKKPFDEFRVGLDHLEFLVAQRSDLDEWARHLDRLGVEHSGVKEPSYTRNAILTFRDPDNIQLEFFWNAPVED